MDLEQLTIHVGNTGVRNNIRIFKSKDWKIKSGLEIISLDCSAWIGTQKYG
jgi:hypothetical protein